MGKYFKWSALATIALAIIYYFVPYEAKPLTIDFLSVFSLGFGKTASNFYSLIFVIPLVMLIAFLNTKTRDIRKGHLIVAAATIIMSLCYAIEDIQKFAFVFYGVMSILFSSLSLFVKCTSLEQLFFRILSSIAIVLLLHTVVLGFYNGALIAGYVLAASIAFLALTFTIAYSYDFLKNLPKIIKTFISWMNR